MKKMIAILVFLASLSAGYLQADFNNWVEIDYYATSDTSLVPVGSKIISCSGTVYTAGQVTPYKTVLQFPCYF